MDKKALGVWLTGLVLTCGTGCFGEGAEDALAAQAPASEGTLRRSEEPPASGVPAGCDMRYRAELGREELYCPEVEPPPPPRSLP